MRFARLTSLGIASAAAVLLSGCGGSQDSASQLPGPANAPGQLIITDNNCLSCHQLGSDGNPSPGGDLTKVGGTLMPAQIRRSLVAPPQGMPSYAQLSAVDREAVVTYLAGLG